MTIHAPYHGISVSGYTRMMANILDGIRIWRGVNYLEHKAELSALAEKEPNVIFDGWLGAYRYYDMDRIIANTLKQAQISVENRIRQAF